MYTYIHYTGNGNYNERAFTGACGYAVSVVSRIKPSIPCPRLRHLPILYGIECTTGKTRHTRFRSPQSHGGVIIILSLYRRITLCARVRM